jgi:hypothetical protein
MYTILWIFLILDLTTDYKMIQRSDIWYITNYTYVCFKWQVVWYATQPVNFKHKHIFIILNLQIYVYVL